MATTQELLKYLSDNDIEFSILSHGKAKSALDISDKTRLPVRYIVQTVPIHINGQSWMIILPADRIINFSSIYNVLKAKNIEEGHNNDWSQYFPNCELDTVPPFGNLYGFRVLADASLEEGRRIIFSACSNTQSIFMRWDDYARLVQPFIADISKASPFADSNRKEQSTSIIPEPINSCILTRMEYKR